MELIKQRHGIEINMQTLDVNDPEPYKMLREGKTVGVFQLEGSGMTKNLIELKPTGIEDIIAMISLFRPGPMELIPSYIKRKHKEEEITYLHQKLAPILANTYGVGKIDFLTLLNSLLTLQDNELELQNEIVQHEKSVTQLEEITGNIL